MQKTIFLPDENATHQLGLKLAQTLPIGTIILLQGDLGAGKTTLIKGLGAGLGITEAIVSPTFTLINEYPEGKIPLYHFDLYRLEPPEVAALQLETYWEGIEFPLGIVAIEWSEKMPYLPENYLEIDLHYGESGRTAILSSASVFALDDLGL